MLGLSGCYSNFLPMFRKVAQKERVSLLRLITDVSAIDRKAPDEVLLHKVVEKLKAKIHPVFIAGGDQERSAVPGLDTKLKRPRRHCSAMPPGPFL